MGWEEKAAKAKKGHRPSLKNWERDNLAQTFPPYADALLNSPHPYSSFKIVTCNDDDDDNDGRRWKAVEQSLSLEHVRRGGNTNGTNGNGIGSGRMRRHNNHRGGVRGPYGNVETMVPVVLDACETPPKIFHERYEAKCIPVVIRNVPNGGNASLNSSNNGEGSDVQSCEGGSSGNNRNEMMMEDDGEEKKECDGHYESTSYNKVNNSCGSNNSNNNSHNNKEWPAIHRWTLDALSTDPQLADRPLKCGEDDDGYTIRIKLRYFIEYLRHNRDDSPLYIFDATFDEDKYAKRLLQDYTVPSYFNEDLLGLVGERRRPPYRWFLVGPCRSGTTVHIDPLGTSAWNTLIHGVKRWVLFPPHVPKSVVKGRRLILPGEDDEAIHYFTTILPRMKRRAAAAAAALNADRDNKHGNHPSHRGSSSYHHGNHQHQHRNHNNNNNSDYANFECYEFTQYAGETVFVPHGWWHAVLNVTHTVGITQNYCSRRNFDEVWTQTRAGRKKMSCSWLRRLDDHAPDLARRARELNQRDGFLMWEDDPVEQGKWRRKKAEKERKREEKREKKMKKKEKQQQQQKHPSKKEKWGEHRTTERRRTMEKDDDGDVVMRHVSPES
mmetsp:Transcript_11297/g.24094  ORF Transcript_11297/g.24094 Transcript_11297/m.24094 type:complete len:608 (-) Transcript_11297:276-2099(-)